MALGTPVAAAIAYSAAGGTTVSPAYPSGILASDEVLLFVGQKPSTANGGTVSTPSGWTLRDELTAAGGYGTTLGADTGNTNLRVYSWDNPVAGQTGNLTVTVGTNDICWAFMVRVPTGGSVSYGSADGQRTTTPTSPMTVALTNGTSATNFQAGDLAIWAMCIPTDVTTPSQFSGHSVTASGATFATAAELNEPDSNTGNDIGGFSAYASVSSGSSTAAPSITVTIAGTLTNVRGPIVMLRIRETVQTLTPSKYDNTQTFFSPTVTTTVSLQPSLYTNDQTFYDATVAQTGGVQDLAPSLYTNNQAFFAPTATATYSLSPNKYDNAQTFYAPAVTTSYTLQPALFTNAQTFYSSAVTTSYTLQPALFTNAQTFYGPAVTASYTLQPTLYTNAQTFYSPAVTTSYTLQPTLYTNGQTFYGPVITQSGAAQQLAPDLYSNAQTFYGPTISTSYTLTPTKYDNAQTFYGPTVSASYQLQPTLYANGQTFYGPSITTSYGLAPQLYTNAQTFYAPTVSATYELTPAKYDNAQTFYDPAVTQAAAPQDLAPALYDNLQEFFSATVTATYTLAPQSYVDDGYVDPGYVGPNTGSTAQFYSPTVTPGDVALVAGLFTNSAAFFSPLVVGGGKKKQDWVEENARAYSKAKRRDYTPITPDEQVDWALRMQIDEEDEIVMAVVMAAAPILGAQTWQQ